MNILIPFVLAALPMNVNIGAVTLVIAALSAICFAALYASRLEADARTQAAPAVAALYLAAQMSRARCAAQSAAAVHARRTTAIVQLYSLAGSNRVHRRFPLPAVARLFNHGGLHAGMLRGA